MVNVDHLIVSESKTSAAASDLLSSLIIKACAQEASDTLFSAFVPIRYEPSSCLSLRCCQENVWAPFRDYLNPFICFLWSCFTFYHLKYESF